MTNTAQYYLYVESRKRKKKKKSQTRRVKMWLPEAGQQGKEGEFGERVQTSSNKMNKV